MINYNLNDYNLKKIEALNNKFNFLETEHAYYVYGLAQHSNDTPIYIQRNEDYFPSNEQFNEIRNWLIVNGIAMSHSTFGTKAIVKIGLRKDIRAYPKFAAALIRTLVAFFEGALVLKESFKLPKLKLKKQCNHV